MSQTPDQLGQRALRKLGFALVANAGRPGAGATYAAGDVVTQVMRDLGVVTTEAERVGVLPPVTRTEIAARGLRLVRINPVSAGLISAVSYGPADIAPRALRQVGVNPADLASVATGIVYTKAQIGTMILRKLAVVGSDENPSVFDQAEAEIHVAAVHDTLAALDYVNVAISGVPANIAEYYVIMAANLAAPAFGKIPNMQVYAEAQDAIRLMSLSGAVAESRAEARVITAHDMLSAEGLTDWSVIAIPSYCLEAYVSIVAALIGPVHGRPYAPEAVAEGIARVRRIVLSGPRGQVIAEAHVISV